MDQIIVKNEYDDLGQDSRKENGISLDKLEKESQKKHPKHIAIEDTAHNIDQLNKIIEQVRNARDSNGYDTPQ